MGVKLRFYLFENDFLRSSLWDQCSQKFFQLYKSHQCTNHFRRFECLFPGGSQVKVSACNAGDLGLIPGSGRSPGEGNGTPLQYSCLENPMDRGAWWATVHGVAKSQTRLRDLTFISLSNSMKSHILPEVILYFTVFQQDPSPPLNGENIFSDELKRELSKGVLLNNLMHISLTFIDSRIYT